MARVQTTKPKTEETVESSSPNAAKLKAFDDIIAEANKSIQSEVGTIIAKLSDTPRSVKTISTGSIVLDSILGGGLPQGRLIEIYGPEASGKTSVALTAVGNIQKNGGNAVFIDLENALDPRYAKKLGVDIDALAVSQPDHAEQTFNLMMKLVNSGAVDLIVLDSIASLVPKAEFEADMESQTIGLLARIMSRALRQLVTAANRQGCTIIFINQTRDAIGSFSPYGTPTTTTGGKAMKFYASQRIEVKRTEIMKEGKEEIGTKVRLTVKKNKIAKPFGVGHTVLTFNKGINRAAEMIEEGDSLGIIHKPNNRTYVEAETGEVIGKSKAEAIKALENDPEMLERLSKALTVRIENDMFGDNDSVEAKDELAEDDIFTDGGETPAVEKASDAVDDESPEEDNE